MQIFYHRTKNGFGIIEIIIAAAIIGLALTSLAALSNFALRIQSHLKQNFIATNLAVEAMEATKTIKEEDWTIFSALALDSPYYPFKNGSPLKWSLAAGTEIISGFSRQVVLSQVLRDVNDDIVSSGGIIDPNTRKVTVTVSWNERGNNFQIVLDSYLTNWR